MASQFFDLLNHRPAFPDQAVTCRILDQAAACRILDQAAACRILDQAAACRIGSRPISNVFWVAKKTISILLNFFQGFEKSSFFFFASMHGIPAFVSG